MPSRKATDTSLTSTEKNISKRGSARSRTKSRSGSRSTKSPKGKSKSPARKSTARKRSSSRSRKTPATGPHFSVSDVSPSASPFTSEKVNNFEIRRDTSFEQTEVVNRVVTEASVAAAKRVNPRPATVQTESSTASVTEEYVAQASQESTRKATSASDVVGLLFGIVLMPAMLYYVNLACTKSQCAVLSIPALPNWRRWIDARIFMVLDVGLLFLGILSLIPFGKRVRVDGFVYRCNGMLMFWITTVAYVSAWYLKFPAVKFVLRNYYVLLTGNVLILLVLCVYIYFKSWTAPLSALSASANGNFFNDFFHGREANPRWGSFDFKWFLFRAALLFWLIIELTFLLLSLDRNNLFSVPKNIPLVMVTTFHISSGIWTTFYLEDNLMKSFGFQKDGLGYMMLIILAYFPFLYTMNSRFAYVHEPKISTSLLLLAALVHVIGFVIYVSSNLQKMRFRENPYDPRLARVESMSTGPHSTRLLVGGWWGLCRKPNYLGDIMMAFASALLTGTTHAWPYFYPLFILMVLLPRLYQDEAACRAKYGRYWDTYTKRVPYRLLPGIY